MTIGTHISIIGLPASGKTTFLAALWHMVREPGAVTKLKFASLSKGNYEHLNALAKLWRSGKTQQRTQTSGMKTVVMTLKNPEGGEVEISFPDIPGEEFSDMWEKREIDEGAKETLTAPAIVLIVNGDTIKSSAWINERNRTVKVAGLQPVPADTVDYSADLASTQVKILSILQFLMSDQLDIGPRRLAILISAWDKVEGEQLAPNDILVVRLPLLAQYLLSGRDPWTWNVWGISAQGGDYQDPEDNQPNPETDALRDLDRPSDRIKVVEDTVITSDITDPLDWLIS